MMKKIFTLFSIMVFSAVAMFAQAEIPNGYESIYDVVGDDFGITLPYTAANPEEARLFLGAADWHRDVNSYNFADYNYIDIQIRYYQADTGKQTAFRYHAGADAATAYKIVDLPKNGTDTTLIVRWTLSEYLTGDSIKVGGIWLYNGEPRTIPYTGEVGTMPIVVDYVAIKKKPVLPEGWVTLYSTKDAYEKAPFVLADTSNTEYALSGPELGWHLMVDYDITNYDTLAVKYTYNKKDIDSVLLFRYSFNADGATPVSTSITLPDVPDTTGILYIPISAHRLADSSCGIGGFRVYSNHWRGATTYNPIIIDYVALHTVPVQGVSITMSPEDSTNTQSLPATITAQLYASFDPYNASNQEVTWTSSDPTRATVDANGLVTALANPGDVDITVETAEGGFTDTYTITVGGDKVFPTGINLTEATVSVKVLLGGDAPEYTLTPNDVSDSRVYWKSSDANIFKVDSASGEITSVAAGNATLYVTTLDTNTSGEHLTASCVLEVRDHKKPAPGWRSLYKQIYQIGATGSDSVKYYGLDTTSGEPNALADVPGLFTTTKNENAASLLGPKWGWHEINKYVDLNDFDSVEVAVSFRKEDLDKKFQLRYCFGTDTGTSAIVNRVVTVNAEDMSLIIDPDNDTANYDYGGLKRLGSIKFAHDPDKIDVVVDYVALRRLGGASDIALLSNITIGDSPLPGFDSETFTYYLPLKNVDSVVVEASPLDEYATVVILDGDVEKADGVIDLKNGDGVVNIVVTAEDEVTTKTYTIDLKGTSIEDAPVSGMKLYPTISDGLFNVEFVQLPGSITVVDITGNIIMQKIVVNETEEISLNPGVYFIKLENSRDSKVIKVVCTH